MLEPRVIHRIVVASWVGIVANALLSAAKIAIGLVSASQAVVSDGVDSALDVLTSVVTLVAARIMEKPPDVDHPYGHTRAETIATKALSFVIFFAGAELAVGAIRAISEGGEHVVPGAMAIWITIISIVGKTALAIYKYRAGKATGSIMLVADAKNMRADILISVTVLTGLVFTRILEMPIIDAAVALAVSGWIVWIALQIFVDTNSELMEGHAESEAYQRIFDAVKQVPGAEHPHRARIRSLGGMHIVDLDIEVDPSLSVGQAHEISKLTEEAIKECLPNVYDVLVHVEPLGNIESSERYGLSQRKLDDHRP